MPLDKNRLTSLYSSGKSMSEIAKLLGCSNHKVIYWMSKYKIERRSRSQATYLKLNPNGDPFNIKTNLSPREMYLLGLGIGIYWGEGDKVSHYAVRVANTDPQLLKVFIKFLQKICRVKQEKLSFSIVCFNNTSLKQARSYWARELQISPIKFGKITEIPTQGKGTYKRKSKFGVCTVHVGNIKLKRWIQKQIRLANKLSLGSLVAKQTLGKG